MKHGNVNLMIGGAAPSWIPAEDLDRLNSYTVYEDMYWNETETYKIIMRDSTVNPMYVPNSKIIIEATNRFLAQQMQVVVNPQIGSDNDRAAVQTQLDRLFRREQFFSKMATQRRFGLIRGDSVWHMVADPEKPAGRRISLYTVDPGSYFPIYENDDLDRRVGAHLVEQIELEDGKVFIKRQTYRKDEELGAITHEIAHYEVGAWDDRNGGEIKKITQVKPPTPLPETITSIPVYHIRNIVTPGDPYGSSELRGLERIMAGVSQTISDEELALALEGLGLYVTNSGAPVDDDGNETSWVLGPGRVVEIDGESTFQRLQGISSVQPALDHVKFILDQAYQASGVPDIAIGNVDVQVAESGIALSLRLAPILSKNKEKEDELADVYNHMMYDITREWLPTFEGLSTGDTDTYVVFGDPVPENKKAKVSEILQLVGAKAISIRTAHVMLNELGYNIPDDEFNEILAEATATVATQVDPYADRANEEIGAATVLDPEKAAAISQKVYLAVGAGVMSEEEARALIAATGFDIDPTAVPEQEGEV